MRISVTPGHDYGWKPNARKKFETDVREVFYRTAVKMGSEKSRENTCDGVNY